MNGENKMEIMHGLGNAEKAANQREYKCIFPECNSKSIRSHSQQKKSQLEAIAENSEVFTKNQSIYQAVKTETQELLSRKNIGEASRFKGYCNTHDTNIFSPIENGSLDIDNPEHNFLLLLRSFSYEYSNKREMRDMLSNIRPLLPTERKKHFEDCIDEIDKFLELDSPYYLSKLFEIYESKDWASIKYNSFLIDKNIGISSTTCFSPLGEQYSEWMSENYNELQPFISLSVIPSKQSTAISFVWFSEIDRYCQEFSRISDKQNDFFRLINMYVFGESEDVCVKPSLWERLTKEEKKIIYQYMGERDSLPSSYSMPIVLSV